MNFLHQWLSGRGTVGQKAWKNALAAGYNKQQIKVAVQQLVNAGIKKNEYLRGAANKGPDREGNPMRGVAGMYSPLNPLGKYQGHGGNLGKRYYAQARDSGEFNLADIPELARQSGMMLPHGAQAQWEMDMAAQHAEEKFDEDPVNYSTAGADVGSSAAGVLTATDPNAGPTGSTQDLKRPRLQIVGTNLN